MYALKNILKKLKTKKNIELIAAGVIAVIILAVYFAPSGNKNSSTNQTTATTAQTTATANSDEQRLKQVLSGIDGAGNVDVMITYDTSKELVPAESVDTYKSTQSDTSGASAKQNETVTQKQSPVTVNQGGQNAPIVLMEKEPKIRGVIVISEGAGDISVKMNLYKAVQTLLQIPSDKVDVFIMNSNKKEN